MIATVQCTFNKWVWNKMKRFRSMSMLKKYNIYEPALAVWSENMKNIERNIINGSINKCQIHNIRIELLRGSCALNLLGMCTYTVGPWRSTWISSLSTWWPLSRTIVFFEIQTIMNLEKKCIIAHPSSTETVELGPNMLPEHVDFRRDYDRDIF